MLMTFYNLANRNHVMKNKPSWSSSLLISLRDTSFLFVFCFGFVVVVFASSFFSFSFSWGEGLLGENKILINLSETGHSYTSTYIVYHC